MQYYLAIDIGASSGRHMLGWVDAGKICMQEVYRFANGAKMRNGRLCWDIDGLFGQVVQGLKECAKLGKIPTTVGVDTWAVDFVLLDAAGKRLGNAVAYRDAGTKGMAEKVEKIISFEELYGRVGIQKQQFNTIYQLMALKQNAPEMLQQAESFLMIPDYLHYLLSGVQTNEYTNATSTALVNAKTKQWDKALINSLAYPEKLFKPLVLPGASIAGLRAAVQAQVGFNCGVLLPPSHDTASAYLAVPAQTAAATLSSGTWSLLGMEVDAPILCRRAMQANFTNEGGYEYRTRFLKNIMGLWMIQNIRKNLGNKYSFAQLEALAAQCAGFASLVDVNNPRFLAPKNMAEEVKKACEDTGQAVPETVGELMRCVYQSLAVCYAKAIEELESITCKKIASINIVGGGSKDGYLNQLAANATGLPVFAGPAEGTVIGNLMVQMLAAGEFAGLQQARQAVAGSFAINKYCPKL